MATLTAAQASALMKAQRQRNNELTCAYFAAGILALITIVTVAHWIDNALQWHSSSNSSLIRASRRARSLLLRKVPGFSSLGHLLIFTAYLIINITLSFTNMNWSILNNWGKRLGWIASCNIALITFLALKNTPLAPLTARSYERLQILHQGAGYATIIWMFLHAIVYIAALVKSDHLEELTEHDQIMGSIAGVAMLIMGATAFFLRRARYEIFYIIHVAMFIIIVITAALHRPKFGSKSVIIFIFTGCLWFSDRLIRGLRILFNAYGNNATLTALPHGGVRVTMRRSLWFAKPAEHLVLWVPRVRKLETHPFTIVSTNPLELVVKAHDGFTRDLRAYALANPGAALRASVDGPYGAIPSFVKYDRLVLIAGGSGSSFTFGAALSVVRSAAAKKPFINFVWVVRDCDNLKWYTSELSELRSAPNVQLTLHISQSTSSKTSSSSSIDEKGSATESPVTRTPTSTIINEKSPVTIHDVEKTSQHSSSGSETLPSSMDAIVGLVNYGRPDVGALLQSVVGQAASEEKILVGVCGPRSLNDSVRSVVVGDENVARRVKLHMEEFGW